MQNDNEPTYGLPPSRWVGFGAAIAICFRKYVDFTGRAGRPEFWFWTLFHTLVLLVPPAVITLLGDPEVVGSDQGAAIVAGLFVITLVALFLPNLAVTVRRLHDTDRTGWWILISIVPTVGGLILLIFLCIRGTAGANRFGPQVAI